MKINHYAVIPAQVRYDKALTDKAKLLFGEISAATNAYGVCEEDNGYFAAALQVDSRTISRCIGQLFDQGHLQRFTESGRRKLKIVTKGLPLPEGVEVEMEEVKPMEDISPFRELLFNLWDSGLNMIFHNKHHTEKRENYDPTLRQRLQSFTRDEILSSVKNRINFMSNSDWYKDNFSSACTIEHIIKDDATVLRWLNAKPAPVEEIVLTPIKKETLPQ
jgi:hypothetical protein